MTGKIFVFLFFRIWFFLSCSMVLGLLYTYFYTWMYHYDWPYIIPVLITLLTAWDFWSDLGFTVSIVYDGLLFYLSCAFVFVPFVVNMVCSESLRLLEVHVWFIFTRVFWCTKYVFGN